MSTPAGLYIYKSGQWVNRNAGVAGGMPGSNNTGVPAGKTLTSYTVTTGNVVIDGTNNPAWVTGTGTSNNPYVIDSVDLLMTNGILSIRTGNVVIKNSRIHTTYFATASTGIISCTSTGLPHAQDALIVQDCEIYCDTPSYWMDGVIGHGFTLKRCNIYHVVDGVGTQVAGTNTAAWVMVDSSWVHDLLYYEGMYAPTSPGYANGGSPNSNTSITVNNGGDPQKPDGSHNDCIQPQGGTNQTFTNNYLDARMDTSVDSNGATTWMRKSTTYALTDPAGNGKSPWGTNNANSAFQFNNNQSGAYLNNIVVTGNWLRGGRFATVNWGSKNAGDYSNFTFQNNVFMTPSGYTIPPWSSTGQFGYDDSGNPITGAQPQAYSPGYPISVHDPDQISVITNGGNTMYDDGSLAPWRGVNSTVVRTG